MNSSETGAAKVFVHGNPEVAAIWGPLHDQLAVDHVVAISPPGFGAAVPDGFMPTMSGYVDWLVGELETIATVSGPVDLVGHDWGSGHVLGTIVERPDLVRTWAVDVLGLCHADYAWHEAAQGWQQAGVGEEMIEAMVSLTADERVALFGDLGLPGDVLRSIAEGIDAEMGRCILGLYRDAVQPAMSDLGSRLAAAALPPGLAIDATSDAYVATALTEAMASRLGIATLELEGNGHWWMLEDPGAAAAGLTSFWSTQPP